MTSGLCISVNEPEVEAVEVARAVHLSELAAISEAYRIPDELRGQGYTFWSVNDRYLYTADSDDRTCTVCSGYDGQEFEGLHLRDEFPYWEIIDYYWIAPHVHPRCRCLLSRLMLYDEDEELGLEG